MPQTTPRFDVPLLAAGQAQKEVFHNEAIGALEMLVQPVAQTQGDNMPPAAPVAGQCWIVGPAPTGDWAGQAGTLAGWTDGGGWRFIAAVEGMTVWIAGSGLLARYRNGAWLEGVAPIRALTVDELQVVGARQPAIAGPSGGGVIDAPARAALEAVLTALRAHGLIAS